MTLIFSIHLMRREHFRFFQALLTVMLFYPLPFFFHCLFACFDSRQQLSFLFLGKLDTLFDYPVSCFLDLIDQILNVFPGCFS